MTVHIDEKLFDALGLADALRIWNFGLAGLSEEDGADTHIPQYREEVEASLKELDTLVLSASTTDARLLERWATLMKLCRSATDRLDRNLPFIGQRQWSWPEVISAMATLQAVCERADIYIRKAEAPRAEEQEATI